MSKKINNESETIGGNTSMGSSQPQISTSAAEAVNEKTAKEDNKTDKMTKKARGISVTRILFILSIAVWLAAMTFIFLHTHANRYSISWKRQLTSLTELVSYRNGDYQLRDAFDHKRISKRYTTIKTDYMDSDSVLILGDKERYVIFSLKTNIILGTRKYNSIPWKQVFRPDSRGVAAVVDNDNRLHFLNVHSCAYPLPPSFMVQDCLGPLPEIRFQNGYCVIPHVDKGACLIDTIGDIFMDGCKDIDLKWDGYALTTDAHSGRKTLYRISDMRPLVSDKEDIFITPIGISYFSDGRWYLTDSTASRILTDVIVDVSDSYHYYTGVETLYEPDDIEIPSPYKTFMVDRKTGVFDQNYQIIIKPKWEEIHYLGDDRFSCVFHGDKAVFIDKYDKMLQQQPLRTK